jgi:hypothetical protein
MEAQAVCHCGKPLPPRFRKYCVEHSPLASLLWKRAQRQACRGTEYWLDYWLNLTGDERSAREAYNAYMRNYMRRYRRTQHRNLERLADRAADNPEALRV